MGSFRACVGTRQACVAVCRACWVGKQAHASCAFLFFYFSILFFTKIYFCFRNLQEYTPAAPLLGGRDLAARQRGGRGISGKKNSRRKLRAGPWGPVARQRSGRPPRPPGCRATGSPTLI